METVPHEVTGTEMGAGMGTKPGNRPSLVREVHMRKEPTMTDDELFTLTTRIQRIEHAIITCHTSTDPDDPYTHAQLDTALGFITALVPTKMPTSPTVFHLRKGTLSPTPTALGGPQLGVWCRR